MIVYEEIFKKHGLSLTQQEILKIVGSKKKVLEIGSSTGYMTKAFLENSCIVDVVELNKKAISKLPKSTRKAFNKSIEDESLYKLLARDYEYIIMADVLEHLVNPEKVLKLLKNISSSKTILIISLPNVAHWIMRKQLFFKGDFEYQESGLLDKTHLHFYTVQTLPKLLDENGWHIGNTLGTITRIPFEGLINKLPIFGWLFKKSLYKKIVEKYKNLTYFHLLVTASKK